MNNDIINYKRPLILHCWNAFEIYPAIAIVELSSEFLAELARQQAVFASGNNSATSPMRLKQSTVHFYQADDIDLRSVYADLEGKAWGVSETEVQVPKRDYLMIGNSWIEVSRNGFSWIAELPQYGKEMSTSAVELETLIKYRTPYKSRC